ncbi:LPS export ABC transporter permease LptG [Exilibacterium tricleocarpae]|uniref:LPS export ABC transporter permease LptG n=1 Tax=Exilibacterium tricleocarpae TaxID=2591008 RepID=A0A545U8E5_9GAMM|nr:LPS export ABC transporter permease LptG [Exilibacterium tricleocarpae]TQV85673.1 LPS export ABC transporter permease LptG [Exilibacterium tricleocarpae]
MRRLNRYVGRAIIGSVATVLLVLVALDGISALVDEMSDRKDAYTGLEVLIYVGLTLPARLYEQIPFAVLVGCLWGLGSLAGASELVVMRAAGVSVARVSWMVLKPVLWFMALGLALGEYVIPYTDQIAESRRALAQGEDRALQSRRGLWSREGDEYMHFNAVLPNGVLFGVTRYGFDERRQLVFSSFTKRATYQGGGVWLEEQGQVTDLSGAEITTSTFTTRRWRTGISPALLNILVLPPEALSIRRLYSYATYLGQQGLGSDEYWLAFWQKLLQPLAAASLVLIAISFIFGPLREVTMGFRVFSGVVVGIVFRTSQDLLGPSSLVFGFSPLLAVLVPILICAAVGVVLLRRSL